MSHEHKGRGVTLEEFQKIRNDRTLELRSHNESMRQHDLQRIRDMKSRNGIHPLERFPKEIWENIFQFLNPSSLEAISEVHDVFQVQLSKRRVYDILLPKFLNLISPEDADHYNGDKSDVWMEENPLKEVKVEELIPLRTVSKSLRNNVDHLFETMIMNRLYSNNEYSVETFTLCFSAAQDEILKLDGILENFGVGSNKATRFFLRSLQIDLIGFDIKKRKMVKAFIQFKSKVSKFLEIVGDQIWRCEFRVSRLETTTGGALSSQIYVALMEWAELMPNLKWLLLVIKYAAKKIQNLPPFPCLKHLVRIFWGFAHANYEPSFQIFSAILKANPHVKVLNLSEGLFDQGENDNFFQNHFNPLLASIPSLALEACFFYSDRFESESIQPALNPIWPLKSLHLGCDLFNSRLKSVFEFVQNFQSLEQFVLGQLVAPRFVEDIPFLNLPNLKYMKVEVNYYTVGFENHVMELTPSTNFFFSLQFLLFSKQLKKLVWKLKGWRTQIVKLRRFLVNRECNEQCVNFRAGMRDLRSSNLWDIFPSLGKVTTEIRKADENTMTLCSYDNNEYRRSERF